MFNLRYLENMIKVNDIIRTRGKEHYTSGAVQEVGLYSNDFQNVVYGKIKGSKFYEASITFDRNLQFTECRCSCPNHPGSYRNICEHIAALYFYILNSKTLTRGFNFIAGKEFLETFFEISETGAKREINITYIFEHVPYWGKDLLGYLSLKIGIDKLYVVKNLRDFLDAIENNTTLEYGKKFSFKPLIHTIKEMDNKIIDFLSELYSAEKAYKSENYYGQGGIFSGKNVKMGDSVFIKFCNLIGDRGFDFKLGDKVYENVKADFENKPFEIKVDTQKENIVARIDYKDDAVFLGREDNIVFCDNKIYILDKSDKSYQFHRVLRKRKVESMEFEDEDRKRFLSVIPSIINEKNIKVSEDIAKNYVKSELSTDVYLSKYKKGISIETIFKYGEDKFNPFYGAEVNPFVIREYIKENEIIRLIEEADFKVKDNIVYLDDYDKIYLFFRDILPVLSTLGTVYYTDDVKTMYTGTIKSYRSSVRSGFEGIIDIDIDIEGLDKKEIAGVLKALKEKKKYHRLRSGRIISLEGDETKELLDILDKVEEDEIKDDKISLTKFRAINVFERIKSSTSINIENSDIVNDMIERIKHPDNQNITVPKRFNGILRDYQSIGFMWLKTLAESGLGGVLADDMGLGKTLQAITMIYEDGGSQTSMVVAPPSLVYNWENEIKKFAPEIKVLVISGSKKTREEMICDIQNYDVVITSYPLIRRDIELYDGFEFKYCILDEAQHIKNPDSVNSQSVKRISAKNRFALTGTPMENSLIELWSIFDFLMPGYLLSRNRFQERFERPIIRDEDREVLSEFKKIVSPFILRRKKKDVLRELPDKIETKMVCELTEDQKKIYTAYVARTKEEVQKLIEEEGFEKSRIQILSALTRLRQICCHPSVFIENYSGGSGKLELLEELIEELLAGEHRMLLFSQFTSLLSIIKEMLDRKGIRYMYLDGNTHVEKRMNLVDKFNSGEGSIFLISLKAGGTGLNLTSADSVIHFDPWWNPAVEEQAEDRAHRIGQENVVQVFKLITKDTIEEKIFELQNKKRELINSVIQEGETFISKLTKEEIMQLFSS